ncbi:MAG: NAD-dependent epimerase/dehydratase family protein [Planctomycetota bacterium]
MDSRPLRIVLVGGSGFIGTRLARRLIAAGQDVRIADLQPSVEFAERWQPADITNRATLETCLAGADWIVHLAAVHRDDLRPTSLYHAVNVGGTQNLCSAAEVCGVKRILFVSSVAVYGPADGEQDEAAPAQPTGAYGRSKWEAEETCRAWRAGGADRRLIVVRPTVVFGEGNRGNLYKLFRQIHDGPFCMVGSGRNVKSIAYVENVAQFLAHCLALAPQAASEQLFNYADKPDLMMNELVVAVRAGLGRPARTGVHLPLALGYGAGMLRDLVRGGKSGGGGGIGRERILKFVTTTQYSAARALATGFKPAVGLAEALRRTLSTEFPPVSSESQRR